MDIVIWLVVFGMYFFLCKLLWSWNWAKPKSNLDKASKKRIKNLKEQLSEVETQRRVGQTLAVASMFGKVPLIGFTKERRETIRLLLQAVDKRDARDRAIMPEEIYVQQLQMVALLISFTCAVAVILRQPFVLLVLLASPIVMASMLGDLQKEREDTSQAISSEFLAFYKVYYVQFSRRDVTNTLANVVRSFMPRASDAFKKALGRFAGDLESGEDYALHAFDARFPENMKVHSSAQLQGLVPRETMRLF